MLGISLLPNPDGTWTARANTSCCVGTLTQCYDWLGALALLL